ncbi:hypothetical protein PLICRDRAFT_254317 [Plicaturopsis crispa FD-325 SS-3]|nr:hypothetical protein PLICRDRAFT_254317 [Plicaturopsis crispa FD-325 SS-3]
MASDPANNAHHTLAPSSSGPKHTKQEPASEIEGALFPVYRVHICGVWWGADECHGVCIVHP